MDHHGVGIRSLDPKSSASQSLHESLRFHPWNTAYGIRSYEPKKDKDRNIKQSWLHHLQSPHRHQNLHRYTVLYSTHESVNIRPASRVPPMSDDYCKGVPGCRLRKVRKEIGREPGVKPLDGISLIPHLNESKNHQRLDSRTPTSRREVKGCMNSQQSSMPQTSISEMQLVDIKPATCFRKNKVSYRACQRSED